MENNQQPQFTVISKLTIQHVLTYFCLAFFTAFEVTALISKDQLDQVISYFADNMSWVFILFIVAFFYLIYAMFSVNRQIKRRIINKPWDAVTMIWGALIFLGLLLLPLI